MSPKSDSSPGANCTWRLYLLAATENAADVVLGMRRDCALRGLHPERNGQVLDVVQFCVL